VETEQEYLKMLAEHELKSSERYRRFFSVLVCDCEVKKCGFEDLFADSLRASDEVVDSVPYVTVLMGETDTNGAQAAANRLRNVYGSIPVHFGVASYPADGRDLATLLSVALKRLSENSNPDSFASPQTPPYQDCGPGEGAC
jgi:hypothetical protein